jgi:hypothetical protein
MARFRLTRAISTAQVKFVAGEIVCDTPGAAVAGDKVWVGLTAATMGSGMIALDSGATTMKAASAWANEQAPLTITGVDSVGR